MLPVFAHIHRPLRLKAAKEREQAKTSLLNLPRSSFAAAVAAKKGRPLKVGAMENGNVFIR